MDINNLTQQQKVEALQALYHDVASMGREGDTTLAHINPQEAALLKALGGSGTINPNTGLPEYKKAVKKVGKLVAKVAPYVLAAYGGYQMAGGSSLFAAGGSSGLSGAMSAGKFINPALISAPTAQAGLSIGSTIGAGISKVGSMIAANPFQAGGMALQGVGYVQQRKAVNAQAEALEGQARAETEQRKMQQRYQETLARRQRLDLLRQQRIISGGYQASAAGAGLGVGTSGLQGATSSIQTQTTANIGAVDFGEGASQAMNNQAQLVANYGTDYYKARGQESMWTGVSSLGESIFNKGEFLNENVFGIKPIKA
jgi:hypothetical protein